MFTFDVKPDNGEPFRVTATSRDVSFWERSTKGASISQIESNARMSDLESIAHIASQRHDHFDGNLASFRELCDIEMVDPDAEDEAGPTQTAR